MRILFIAPLPPPINGQALASDVFLKELQKRNEVIVIDTAKHRERISTIIKRMVEVLGIVYRIYSHRRGIDLIYLTISESLAGNARDLLTYLICYNHLDRMVIHLHGGASMTHLMNRTMVGWINRYFMARLKGIIVLGETQRKIFHNAINPNRLYSVPNFAEDYLFASHNDIRTKYSKKILTVLFLSNLLPGKGHTDLLDAYISLTSSYRSLIHLHFAGAFESEPLKRQFLNRIQSLKNVYYHGVVQGEKNRELFLQSQIFCLPTYYSCEGQPISILEAYAAGCVVITTNHSGIKDIFADKQNGYQVDRQSPTSLREVLESALQHPADLMPIGLFNWTIAQEKYRTAIYNQSLTNIMGL
jgi:glycosyltransferase involved in cell wall biosynthesis